ncbi:MAG: hypothetical protein QW818_02710 [Candidatus Aenigmatarchaeota archaeon]|nr:hypothetical protein [Candidatus Aenigmarchaeota archaeon]
MAYSPFQNLRAIIESVRSQTPVSRRELLQGCVEAAAYVAMLHLLSACKREELSYTEAQKGNYMVRQRYINAVVRKHPIKNLESATYTLSQAFNPKLNKPMPMSTTAILPPGARAASAKIEVSPLAFLFQNEDEFLSALVDHEYIHVKLLTEGIEISAPLEVHQELKSRVFNVNGDLFDIFNELEAFSNQIRQFPNRRISKDFKDSVLDSYRIYRQFLEGKERTPVITWMLERYPYR